MPSNRFLPATPRPRTRVLTHFDTRTTQSAASRARKHHSPPTSDPRETDHVRGVSAKTWRRPIDGQEPGHRLPDKLLAVPRGKKPREYQFAPPNLPPFRDVFITGDRLFPWLSTAEDHGRVIAYVARTFWGQTLVDSSLFYASDELMLGREITDLLRIEAKEFPRRTA